MAITVRKKKDGKVETTYSGFDKVAHKFGSALEKIKSAPKRAIDSYEGKLKKMDAEKRKRNTKMIERAFGSVENYEKFNRQSK